MSAVNIQLPESLHERLRRLAEQDGVSVEQFITLAVAEKMSALLTAEYLENQTTSVSRARFLSLLDKAPDVAPDESDRI